MYHFLSLMTSMLTIAKILRKFLTPFEAITCLYARPRLPHVAPCVFPPREITSLEPGAKPSQRSPLHALIIGINTYRSERITQLRGAVNDAEAVYNYLRTELHVPDNQIVNLRNSQATRQAIIRELRAFRARKSIRRGDPILIFFAGHGATAKAPEGWVTANQKISLILPYDSLVSRVYGGVIQPIPDRTIGAILHDLAEDEGGSMGNNITVILDCCHSGSGTRQVDSETILERGIELEEEHLIPPNLDRAIWSKLPIDRAIGVAAGFAHSGTRSHVLLAACREGEKAQEDEGGGVFTRALLDTLRTLGTSHTTYQSLMQRIGELNIPGQTPQCEGRHSDRILFNALVPSDKSTAYPVLTQDDSVVIAAGSVHGVRNGSRFSIYPSRYRMIGDEPWAIMEATAVGPFQTKLSYVAGAPICSSACFAFDSSICEVNAIRLYIQDADDMRPVVEALAEVNELQRRTASPALVRVTEDGDETQAHFSVVARDRQIEYLIHDDLITVRGLRRLHPTTKAEAYCIYPILRAATHFFWHLHHEPEKPSLREHIRPRIYELKKDEHAELGLDLRLPWTTYGESLLCSGAVNVVADQGTVYGIALQNTLEIPLHIWAFYFDCSDLSITEYYTPLAIGRGAEPSLPARGCLTIGYGDGGGRPFTYFLRQGQVLDVGFIKLFISTEYIDLSFVEQESPFEIGSPRGSDMTVEQPAGVWDTLLIPVVQHKAGSP
ncbi:hypothetical protein PENSPDRAFT_230413 [Peniophora sp. CONT]|nr:hypothetical protein PENSPDRAFT_230413 [Peniophora sp. CONT]